MKDAESRARGAEADYRRAAAGLITRDDAIDKIDALDVHVWGVHQRLKFSLMRKLRRACPDMSRAERAEIMKMFLAPFKEAQEELFRMWLTTRRRKGAPQ